MLVEKVSIRNFLSHRNTELEFREGVTAFIGPNGAGKSSILDAISYALFKEHSRGRGLEGLVRRGAKTAEVSVQFRVGENRYLVVRRLSLAGKSVKGEAYLYLLEDGRQRLVARGEREVTGAIQKLLGIDKTVFLNAVYVRQGEIDRLVSTQPAERKRVVSRLLGIDDLEKAWSLMRDVISVYEERRARLEALAGEEPGLREKLSEMNRRLLEKNLSLKKLGELRVRAEKRLDEARAELQSHEEKARKWQALTIAREAYRAKLSEAVAALEDLRKDLEAVKAAERRIEGLKPLVEKLPFLEEYASLRLKEEGLRKEEEMFKGDLRRVEEATRLLKESEEGYRRYLELRKLEDKYRELVSEARLALDGAKRADEYLSTVSRRLSEKKRLLDSVLKNFEEKLNVSVKIDDVERLQSNAIKQRKAEISRLEEKLAAIRKAIGESQGKLVELEENELKVSAARGSCPLCGAPLSEAKRKMLLETYASARRRLENEISDLLAKEKRLEQLIEAERVRLDEILKLDVSVITRLRNEVRELEEEAEKARKEASDLREKGRRLADEARRLAERLKEVDRLQKAYETYIAASRMLEAVASVEELKARLQEVVKRREAVMSRMLELRKALGWLAEAVDEEVKRLRRVKEEYDVLVGKASRRREIEKRIADLEAEKRDLVGRLEKIEEELSRLGYDEAAHKECSRRLESIEAEYRKLVAAEAGIRSEITALEERRKELEERLAKAKEAALEYRKLARFIGLLEKIRAAYSREGLQRKVRALAKPMIEVYVKELFSAFGLDYSDLKLDDDYGVILIGPGGERNADVISGGEKTALGIALRLGLARAVAGPHLEMMMLDEPTVNMDEERRRELINILKTISEGGRSIPQLLIVTHDREIEDAADEVYIVSKENSISKVSRSTSVT